MKILILKPSSLGDIIHALPVLRLLRRHLPDAEIDWWVDAHLSPILEGDPDLTRIIRFERRRWVSPFHWHEAAQSVRELRARQYDWVLDLQALARSAIVAWLAHGHFTIGLDDPREGAPAFYDVRVPRPSFFTHAVDWYLEILRVIQVPVDADFAWIPPRPAVGHTVQARWLNAARTWVAFQPGARWTNKRWPAEHFIRLIQQLAAARPDLHFLILGAPADQPLGGALGAAAPGRSLDLTGRTTIPEMIECLRRSQLLVTNDTGPMHIAAALGVPVVALFGPTEPRRTGPYRQLDAVMQHRLECVPCLKSRCHYPRPMECLRGLQPDRVLQRVLERL